MDYGTNRALIFQWGCHVHDLSHVDSCHARYFPSLTKCSNSTFSIDLFPWSSVFFLWSNFRHGNNFWESKKGIHIDNGTYSNCYGSYHCKINFCQRRTNIICICSFHSYIFKSLACSSYWSVDGNLNEKRPRIRCRRSWNFWTDVSCFRNGFLLYSWRIYDGKYGWNKPLSFLLVDSGNWCIDFLFRLCLS